MSRDTFINTDQTLTLDNLPVHVSINFINLKDFNNVSVSFAYCSWLFLINFINLKEDFDNVSVSFAYSLNLTVAEYCNVLNIMILYQTSNKQVLMAVRKTYTTNSCFR